MMNLSHLFKQPLRAVPNSLVIFLLIVALVGFVDAGYLTIEHYQNAIPPCSITGGCEKVLTSAYAAVFGIPVSLLGSFYYVAILIGICGYLESKKILFLKWALLLTFAGFLASLWFVFLQAFVIRSYCLYCLGSAITSTILFVTAMDIFRRYGEVTKIQD